MNKRLDSINDFLCNNFIFLPQYHIWRHVAYWVVDVLVWSTFWSIIDPHFWHNIFRMLTWLPVFALYSYPLVYWMVPKILLKGSFLLSAVTILLWGIAGWYIFNFYRVAVFIPVQIAMDIPNMNIRGAESAGYLCMTTTASGIVVFAIFKQWIQKQRQWLQAQHEKATAELQLLKAQVHPHFLFNTLNNIYSFSLENSPKTPELILKLSNLLSYMLYDCKAAGVRLEKELQIMKNYTELEKERYGSKIDISWHVEGEVQDKSIAPLMMLPFLENAFKHGTSEQIEKGWLSVDISVKENILKAKIANSKNEYVPYRNEGIGIANVIKRLDFIYPAKHELKISDEGNFFVVSLVINLSAEAAQTVSLPAMPLIPKIIKPEVQYNPAEDWANNLYHRRSENF